MSAQQFFDLDVMARVLPILLSGLKTTLLICCAVIPLGLAGGLVVAALRQSSIGVVRGLTTVCVDILRALPPLFLLILVYAGLPFLNIRLSAFVCVCLAFLLNTSAYYGEVFRAGFDSVAVGQREAARATGLTALQSSVYVILPQAVRNVLPDLVSNTIEVVKLTALASVVALPELLYSADMARAATSNSSPIVLAALIYLIILWPAVRMASRLEHRVGR